MDGTETAVTTAMTPTIIYTYRLSMRPGYRLGRTTVAGKRHPDSIIPKILAPEAQSCQ